jgi:hypothetical protein
MPDLIQALLQQGALQNNQFASTSRYYGIETSTYDTADGQTVAYVKRRFLPTGDKFTVLQEHTVKEGERLDNITAQYLGDPEQFWRICDANEVMRPEELVEEPGNKVKITLPEGITGAQHA